MIDLGDDAVVYVDCEEHRLVTKVLQDNDSSRRLQIIPFRTGKPRKTRKHVVHVNYKNYGMVYRPRR